MIARALAVLLVLWTGIAAAEVAVPALTARVTDLTGTLDAGERAALEARLATFERQKGSQIAVLLVPTTQPETVEQFGIRVADAWKIGREGVDDGVILIVAKDDRALRIEVGYGLEGALPDAIAKRIIEEVILPRFRAGEFYGGISDGVDRIIRVIEGEPLPPPRRSEGQPLTGNTPIPLLVVLPLVVGGFVRMVHNRFTGAAVAGGLSGLLGWWWLGATAAALVVAFFCFAFVLGAGGGGRRRRRGWASGGWGGGWGGGFGGGGGFSGGGGGFGGGGASGRW